MTSEPTPGHPHECSCGECEFKRTNQPGLHGIDFGGGFLAVFCERENLLAMYPHVCPDLADDAQAAARLAAESTEEA